MLWKAARLAAIAKSGKLAVLDSAEKQSRFKTAMLTAKATGKLWIGGHDTLTEGRFRWLTTNGLADVTGALVAAPTNWQPFQPNNLNNADAMEAFSDADFKWAMAPVSKIQAYAIEYHASNPNSNDSDGDGALDNEERVLGSNPLDPSSVPTFDLKLTTSENGSLTGSGTFSRGATTTLTATPNPGYIFSSWSGDALGTDNPLSITMDSDKTIGANFGPDLADSDGDGYSNYDEIVTYKSNPNNTASIPGDPDGDGFFVAALLEGTGLMDAAGGDTMIVDAEGVPLASGIAAGGYFTMSEAQVVAAVASKDYEQLLAAFVPLVNDDFTTGVRDNYIIDPIPGFHYF